MKIYMVEYDDYDGHGIVGYFLEETKAKECRKYLNRHNPSPYKNCAWDVFDYELNEEDYELLNEELDKKEEAEHKAQLEKEKQEAVAEINRLKEKYGL